MRNETETRTAQLRKYPKRSGARRFQAFYVPVVILREEIRNVPKIRGNGEWNDDGEYVPAARFTVQVKYFQVREHGKKAKWVPESDVVIDKS